ncbi:hypothetical protein SAMN06297468_0874 [Altererythrobacter xiamenensis]|uniref:Uncharacterized protein n=1 Tax=Altererythrobacter xiamenensis TaxID=1316679 RepID=A0A1Y6ELS2_9SPHN|nr:hypothetical protein SAMN06297468_0874 [Altererythrobacter xiamenensis]
MNFGLIPMPAFEELALGYVPSPASSDRRTTGEPVSFRVVAGLYLLFLLLVSPFPADAPTNHPQSDTSETAMLAEAAFAESAQSSLPPSR